MESSSQWNALKQNIDPKDLINLSEAILINYFKPKYNSEYKNVNLTINHKVYKKLIDEDISHVQVNLNLFMQTNKEVLNLATQDKSIPKAKTVFFSVPLDDLTNKKATIKIGCSKISDELYDLLGLGDID